MPTVALLPLPSDQTLIIPTIPCMSPGICCLLGICKCKSYFFQWLSSPDLLALPYLGNNKIYKNKLEKLNIFNVNWHIYRSIVLLVFKINRSSLSQIIIFLLQCYIVRASLCAQCTVKPNKPKCWCLEQRNVYCRAMQGNRWFMFPQI